jgi:Icc-related predicted phosphoesterase
MIAATSDIHSPRYLNEFLANLAKLKGANIDVFLLAGDLTDGGDPKFFSPIYEALKRFKVIAVFGNEDVKSKERFVELFREVTWLDDDIAYVQVRGKSVAVIGSLGVLERPTAWQAAHGIDSETYEKRLARIHELLCEAKSDYRILLTHYLPTYETAYGERREIYPELGFRLIERETCLPNIAVHGHAHKAKVVHKIVRGVRVYNVAFPANRRIVTFPLDPLLEFQ